MNYFISQKQTNIFTDVLRKQHSLRICCLVSVFFCLLTACDEAPDAVVEPVLFSYGLQEAYYDTDFVEACKTHAPERNIKGQASASSLQNTVEDKYFFNIIYCPFMLQLKQGMAPRKSWFSHEKRAEQIYHHLKLYKTANGFSIIPEEDTEAVYISDILQLHPNFSWDGLTLVEKGESKINSIYGIRFYATYDVDRDGYEDMLIEFDPFTLPKASYGTMYGILSWRGKDQDMVFKTLETYSD